MPYLYHRLSPVMKGKQLYPLNQLRTVYPDLYEQYDKKYIGREHITKQRIELLENALWNDVIFLSAIHPQKLFDVRREIGFSDLASPARYVQIDPSMLDESRLAIWLFPKGRNFSNDDVIAYNPLLLESYSSIPEDTRDYFKAIHNAGETQIPLFWRYVPHILYLGTIDITGLPVIECR